MDTRSIELRIATDIREITPECDPSLVYEVSKGFWGDIKLIPLTVSNSAEDKEGFQLINRASDIWGVKTERQEITTFIDTDKNSWESKQSHRYSVNVFDINAPNPIAWRTVDSFQEAMTWHYSVLDYLKRHGSSLPRFPSR